MEWGEEGCAPLRIRGAVVAEGQTQGRTTVDLWDRVWVRHGGGEAGPQLSSEAGRAELQQGTALCMVGSSLTSLCPAPLLAVSLPTVRTGVPLSSQVSLPHFG